jgi:hypothetical protein
MHTLARSRTTAPPLVKQGKRYYPADKTKEYLTTLRFRRPVAWGLSVFPGLLRLTDEWICDKTPAHEPPARVAYRARGHDPHLLWHPLSHYLGVLSAFARVATD